MTLTRVDTTNYALQVLLDFVRNQAGAAIFQNPTTYEEARDLLIKVTENAGLFQGLSLGQTNIIQGGQNVTLIHDDSEGIPTLGYGLNLRTIAADDFDDLFQGVYGDLSTEQSRAVNLLEDWLSGQGVTIDYEIPSDVDGDGQPDLDSTGEVITQTQSSSFVITDADIIDAAQGRSITGNASVLNQSVEFIAAVDAALADLASISLNEAQANTLLEYTIEGFMNGVIDSREDEFDALFAD